MIEIEVHNGEKWERVPIAYDIDRKTGDDICKNLSRNDFPDYVYRLLEDGQPPILYPPADEILYDAMMGGYRYKCRDWTGKLSVELLDKLYEDTNGETQ